MEYVRQLTDPDGCLVPASFRVAESRGRREASRWRAVASREEPVAVERAFCRFCIGLLARDEQTSGGWNQSLHRILDDIVGQIDLDIWEFLCGNDPGGQASLADPRAFGSSACLLATWAAFDSQQLLAIRTMARSTRTLGALLLLGVVFTLLELCSSPSGLPRALVVTEEATSEEVESSPAPPAPVPEEGDNFFSKVFAAAAQGCTAAFVAAILSAMCEPLGFLGCFIVDDMGICEPTPGEANDCGPGIQRDELGTGGQILPHHFSNQHAEIPCLRSHQPSDGIQWTFSQH
eukprot:s66_g19.t2